MPNIFFRHVSDPALRANFEEIARLWPALPLAGSGDPNTVVTGGPGAQYTDRLTGKLWVHEAAVVSDTGWVMK